MPLKLSVGLSRKVGLPGYGSLGAACGVEVELDAGLPDRDPDAFLGRVREAFDACARAVDEELDRRGGPAVAGPKGGPQAGPAWPATGPQLRALRAIAGRRSLDLDALVAARHGVDSPAALSAAEAGELIDELQRGPAGEPG